MEKVGIITIYSVPNYGSVLQAYATQELLKSENIDCIFIAYDRYNDWYKSHGVRRPSLFNRINSQIGITKRGRKSKNLEVFKKCNFIQTPQFKSLKDLVNYNWTDFCAFVVGSDQTWNPRFSYGDSVYLLSFAPSQCYKFSIASSFAVTSLPLEYKEKFRKYLSGFTSISVREKAGQQIINQQLGLTGKAQVILDPTLLLSKEDWLMKIPRSSFVKKEPYILLYFLNYAFDASDYTAEILNYYQVKKGFAIYVLEGYAEMLKYKFLNLTDKTDATIPEFLDLFNGADIVITTSFHGTAFALNFGKPLVSICPYENDDRQISLLNSLGLGSKVIHVGTSIDGISPYYESKQEQEALEGIRHLSLDWIKNNIISHIQSNGKRKN